MNTPTPRTIDDVCHHPPGSFAKYVIEQELSEATVANEAARAVNVQLRKELNEAKSWVKSSMESTAIAGVIIALLESERDTLRKMVDAFADCGDCGDEWLMADYRELPHVRERKAK